MEPSASRQLRPVERASDFIRRVRAIDPHAVDALVALALTVSALMIVIGRINGDDEFRDNDFLGTALVLLQTLPLAVRRVAPLGVLVVINFAIDLHAVAGYEMVQAGTFGSLIALYGAASLTDSRRGIVAALIMVPAFAIFFATNRENFGAGEIASISGTWAVGWFLGTYIRIRGEQAEAAGERAAWLERDRDVRAREAVAEERARIARELHDMVGHALNLIVIQAGGAQRVFESRPQLARQSLAAIESAGREALSDMERMLGMLRVAEGGDQALSPQPGLRQIDSLAARVSEAGLPVEVAVEGSPVELPPSVDLSAYRIVQEALTNSLKHAGASRARVAIRYRPDALDLEITDDGRGVSERGPGGEEGGRGLIGMRERVALFGGELSVGPVPEAGYRVHARLPLKGGAD
jgi:signal transduction histidine kinase